MRLSLVLLVLFTMLLAPVLAASQVHRIREVTEKWREARAAERPLEVYLRPIVAEDPGFNPDPGLALEGLSEEMRSVYDDPEYAEVVVRLRSRLAQLREQFDVPEEDPVPYVEWPPR